MESGKVPGKVRELVDQLGRVFAQAVMTDDEGQELLRQIGESGFDVGLMLEATVALIPKDGDMTDFGDLSSNAGGPFRITKHEEPMPDSPSTFEWSEEDKALLCSFRISPD